MTKADIIFKENIRKIMEEGVFQKMLAHVTRMEMSLIPSTLQAPLLSMTCLRGVSYYNT